MMLKHLSLLTILWLTCNSIDVPDMSAMCIMEQKQKDISEAFIPTYYDINMKLKNPDGQMKVEVDLLGVAKATTCTFLLPLLSVTPATIQVFGLNPSTSLAIRSTSLQTGTYNYKVKLWKPLIADHVYLIRMNYLLNFKDDVFDDDNSFFQKQPRKSVRNDGPINLGNDWSKEGIHQNQFNSNESAVGPEESAENIFDWTKAELMIQEISDIAGCKCSDGPLNTEETTYSASYNDPNDPVNHKEYDNVVPNRLRKLFSPEELDDDAMFNSLNEHDSLEEFAEYVIVHWLIKLLSSDEPTDDVILKWLENLVILEEAADELLYKWLHDLSTGEPNGNLSDEMVSPEEPDDLVFDWLGKMFRSNDVVPNDPNSPMEPSTDVLPNWLEELLSPKQPVDMIPNDVFSAEEPADDMVLNYLDELPDLVKPADDVRPYRSGKPLDILNFKTAVELDNYNKSAIPVEPVSPELLEWIVCLNFPADCLRIMSSKPQFAIKIPTVAEVITSAHRRHKDMQKHLMFRIWLTVSSMAARILGYTGRSQCKLSYNLESCSSGLHFNPMLGVCDYPSRANCDSNIWPPAMVNQMVWSFPSPWSCEMYYRLKHWCLVPCKSINTASQSNTSVPSCECKCPNAENGTSQVMNTTAGPEKVNNTYQVSNTTPDPKKDNSTSAMANITVDTNKENNNYNKPQTIEHIQTENNKSLVNAAADTGKDIQEKNAKQVPQTDSSASPVSTTADTATGILEESSTHVPQTDSSMSPTNITADTGKGSNSFQEQSSKQVPHTDSSAPPTNTTVETSKGTSSSQEQKLMQNPQTDSTTSPTPTPADADKDKITLEQPQPTQDQQTDIGTLVPKEGDSTSPNTTPETKAYSSTTEMAQTVQAPETDSSATPMNLTGKTNEDNNTKEELQTQPTSEVNIAADTKEANSTNETLKPTQDLQKDNGTTQKMNIPIVTNESKSNQQELINQDQNTGNGSPIIKKAVPFTEVVETTTSTATE